MSKQKLICTIQTIDDIVELLDSTGLTYEGIAAHVQECGGKLSKGTVANWFARKVKMPQLSKLLEVTNAFNYQIRVVKA